MPHSIFVLQSVLQVNSLKDGTLLREFDLDIGTIVGTSGEKKYSEIFYNFSSFLNPGSIYRYDFKTPDKSPSVFREIKLNLEGFRREDYAVEQIFYKSKDGTKVPMFIIRKKRDSVEPRPCLLYGYGGFNISMLPSFGLSGYVEKYFLKVSVYICEHILQSLQAYVHRHIRWCARLSESARWWRIWREVAQRRSPAEQAERVR